MRKYIDIISEHQIMLESYDNLASRIDSFISRHAGIRPDYDAKWDEPDERFTGPDSALLANAAERLKAGISPTRVHSDYESGTYKPWNDKRAKAEHDALVAEINDLVSDN